MHVVARGVAHCLVHGFAHGLKRTSLRQGFVHDFIFGLVGPHFGWHGIVLGLGLPWAGSGAAVVALELM